MVAPNDNRTRASAPAGITATLTVRALLLGERLDLRAFERDPTRDKVPLLLDVPGGGRAVLFRYGAAVLFDAAPEAAERFEAALADSVAGPFVVPEREEVRLLIDPW